MLKKNDILRIALEQSAYDCSCNAGDFTLNKHVIIGTPVSDSRKRCKKNTNGLLVSYGSNIVASVPDNCVEAVQEYINMFPMEYCFETPGLYLLNEKLEKMNLRAYFMSEYFLPDPDKLFQSTCPYQTDILCQEKFNHCYGSGFWTHALSEEDKSLDILCAGAYDGKSLIGLAGASADCETMWQLGVDVLPKYRQQGVASAIISLLAGNILKRGIVPFYAVVWSNIRSVRTAIHSGFFPAWIEISINYKGV